MRQLYNQFVEAAVGVLLFKTDLWQRSILVTRLSTVVSPLNLNINKLFFFYIILLQELSFHNRETVTILDFSVRSSAEREPGEQQL